jgi:hypothetical protein
MALPSWPFVNSVRGLAALRQLSEGAVPSLTHTLPPLFAPNISSAYQVSSLQLIILSHGERKTMYMGSSMACILLNLI